MNRTSLSSSWRMLFTCSMLLLVHSGQAQLIINRSQAPTTLVQNHLMGSGAASRFCLDHTDQMTKVMRSILRNKRHEARLQQPSQIRHPILILPQEGRSRITH